MLRFLIAAICFVPLFSTGALAQTFDESFDHWPQDLKINGKIIVYNGLSDFDRATDILGTIATNKSTVCFFHESIPDSPLIKAVESKVGERGTFVQYPFSTLSKKDLHGPLGSAKSLVLLFGESAPEEVGFSGHWEGLREFVSKGGTLVVDAPAAAQLGAFYITEPTNPNAVSLKRGANLLPDCLLLCSHDSPASTRKAILSGLALHPRAVGIALASDSMLMLSGRKLTCHGQGSATLMLDATQSLPRRIESIVPARRRMQPNKFLADLTEWRRDAIDRTLAPFPPAKPDVPTVENGTLVIVGGGGMPAGLMKELIDLAGGTQQAKMVYIPCSEQERLPQRNATVESWKRLGVKHATWIHTKDRLQANEDEEFLEPLKNATGLWFGGGRQWNFSDSYYGTKAHKLMKDVLARGGVIGGSSAGASIQARYLARATPIGNWRIMAPGYERGGLGFISGVAIDQHFSQRRRQSDMTQLMARHPQLLGIGIDEATALIVQKSEAEIRGRGKVYFYDRTQPVYPDRPDYIALAEGSRYDLAKRAVLKNIAEQDSGLDTQQVENQK